MTEITLIAYFAGVIVAGHILHKEYRKLKHNACSQDGMIVIGSALSWATVVVWLITKVKSTWQQ